MKIRKIHARQILDSRGNPTVECDVELTNGIMGRAAVPSGASTGSHEAIELRDGDKGVYLGKGVLKAVEKVNGVISKEIVGMDSEKQEAIDKRMIELDGTENKSKLGANAILAVSLAVAKASALGLGIPLFEYLGTKSPQAQIPLTPFDKGGGKEGGFLLPLPMMNIVNGGRHADFATDIQEFMVIPVGAETFSQGLRMGVEIFHHLARVIKERGYETTVGDEGGFAPRVKKGNAEALELIIEAVAHAGYTPGVDVCFGLDVAASELLHEKKYVLKAEGEEFSSKQMTDWLAHLAQEYPIVSIEDGLGESDWEGWRYLTGVLGEKLQIVGDDLSVTNTKFLERAIKDQAANAILVKPNQIGTLTETRQAIGMAKDAGWNTILSHRSGETEDTTIAHLAVGLRAGQIKTGSLSRTDRVCKYNELLRIEELLGKRAEFAGGNVFSDGCGDDCCQ